MDTHIKKHSKIAFMLANLFHGCSLENPIEEDVLLSNTEECGETQCKMISYDTEITCIDIGLHWMNGVLEREIKENSVVCTEDENGKPRPRYVLENSFDYIYPEIYKQEDDWCKNEKRGKPFTKFITSTNSSNLTEHTLVCSNLGLDKVVDCLYEAEAINGDACKWPDFTERFCLYPVGTILNPEGDENQNMICKHESGIFEDQPEP